MASVWDSVKDSKKIILLAFALLFVSIVGLYLTNNNSLVPNMDNTQNNTKNSIATIQTNKGNIVVELFNSETPKTVSNFVTLSKKGFYNGLTFHRVIPEFVIQGGDPKGDGTGGPGYTFPDEITSRKFEKYVLAMANSGPNTNGSQFFITTGLVSSENLNYLNGKHTIFGIVKEGQSVVDDIAKVQRDNNDKPLEAVTIQSITIVEN